MTRAIKLAAACAAVFCGFSCADAGIFAPREAINVAPSDSSDPKQDQDNLFANAANQVIKDIQQWRVSDGGAAGALDFSGLLPASSSLDSLCVDGVEGASDTLESFEVSKGRTSLPNVPPPVDDRLHFIEHPTFLDAGNNEVFESEPFIFTTIGIGVIGLISLYQLLKVKAEAGWMA